MVWHMTMLDSSFCNSLIGTLTGSLSHMPSKAGSNSFTIRTFYLILQSYKASQKWVLSSEFSHELKDASMTFSRQPFCKPLYDVSMLLVINTVYVLSVPLASLPIDDSVVFSGHDVDHCSPSSAPLCSPYKDIQSAEYCTMKHSWGRMHTSLI